MRSCDMVIIVPVDKHSGNDEVLRLQAWGEVSELLRPGLGKLYRQFNPSGSAWERKYPRPFGVVLGWQEPEVFRELLKAGEEAQHEAVAFHLEAMLRKADLGSAQKIGDTQVYSAVVDGSDPELLAKVCAERDYYYQMIKARADLFTKEAEECGLPMLPYVAGFFLSIPAKNPDAICEKLHEDNIFAVPLAAGVRIAVCAVPLKKIKGMAAKVNAAMQAVGE